MSTTTEVPAPPARRGVLEGWVDAIGLIGPGLSDWAQARGVLRGEIPWQPAPTVLTLPPILPAAERRRTGVAVKAALASGHQAVSASSFEAASLVSVFASSGGDGDNCHAICEALASDDRLISPTRFHNSVHNAPSGYWGIAMSARAASTSLCARDASFGAGLLEALTEVVLAGHPVIVITYDSPYPEPLARLRPLPDSIGLALVLAPWRTDRATGRISVRIGHAEATTLDDPGLEALRRALPTARALPLLSALARAEPGRVALDYLDDQRLLIDVSPC